MASIKERIKRLESIQTHLNTHHIIFKDNYEFDVVLSDGKLKSYRPTQTALSFHSSPAFFRYVQGPFGSGKSTMCMADIVWQSRKMPPWIGGRHVSRGAFIRNTSPELHSTTLKTWLSWFGNLGDISSRQKPYLQYIHRFNYLDEMTQSAGRIELELMFLAFDREADLGALDSLELSFAYINEMRHVPQGLIHKLGGRIGRYPASQDATYAPRLSADSNPPTTRHWSYKAFSDGGVSDKWRMFTQPPGLLKDGEGAWIENTQHDTAQYVRQGYYLDMTVGASEEFIKVYCLGQYGMVKDGKPVYPEYNDDLHSKYGVEPIAGVPIFFGFDFGLTPAAILMQQAPNGQIRLLKEFVTSRMGIKELIEDVIRPYLSTYYPGYLLGISYGDPAGMQGSQIKASITCISTCIELGIPTTAAYTNDILTRLEGVKFWLRRLIDGHPAIIIDRERCPTVREGFISGYHFRKVNTIVDEKYTDTPEKNEFSHPHDATQYPLMQLVPKTSHSEVDYSSFSSRRLGGIYG